MNNEKVHICHLVFRFDIGGLERVVVNSINHLDDNQFRHTIIALTYVTDFISEIDKDVEHYSLNKKAGNDYKVHVRLFKLLRQLAPDVLHTYNLATIEYQWVGLLAGVPLRIHAEHGRDSYDPTGSVKKYQLIRKVCSYAVHKVVAVSSELEEWLSEKVGISHSKLQLIANGIDVDYFNRDIAVRSNNVTELSGRQSSFIFGHVARLHAIKNQIMLLEGFLGACQASEDFSKSCSLVIVGDGPDEKKLKSYVAAHALLKENVIFTGAQSGVRDYYRSFDVFVMSSIAEGVPMTLLESMSMSVPHLVTKVGGIGEVINHGKTGLGVDSGDKEAFTKGLIELYTDSEQVAKMSDAARARIVNAYSQEMMTQKYTDLYLQRS